MYSRLSFFILTGFLILGCSSKRANPVRHEKQKDTRALPVAPNGGAYDSSGELTQATPTFSAIEQIKNESQMLEQILQMEPDVLDENMIADPRPHDSVKLSDNLHLFNQLLLKSFSFKSARDRLKNVYAKYEQLMLMGVDKKDLSYVRYFRRSHLSAEIYGHILELRWQQVGAKISDAALIDDMHRLSAMMFDLGNKNASPFLQGLYLSKAVPYTKALQALGPNSAKELQRHISFTSQMLDEVNLNIEQNCHKNTQTRKVECLTEEDLALYILVQNFMDSIDIWSFQESEGTGMASIKSKFVKLGLHSMYDENGKLSGSLANAIINSQVEEDSFLNRLLKLKKEIGVGGLKEIGLDVSQYLTEDDKLKPEYFNVYFYLVASLFKGKINTEAAGNVWETSSDRDKETLLLNSIEAYIRINVLSTALETQSRLNAYFKQDKYVTANVSGKESLLEDVFHEAESLHLLWKKTTKGVTDLVALAKTFSQKYDVEDENSQMNKIDKMFSSLSKNIGLLSAYPNQMMLMYLVTKDTNLNTLIALEITQHQDMFHSFLSLYEMGRNKSVPRRFFEDGVFLPWFEFTNGHYLGAEDQFRMKLTKWDMLYAHIYGAATKLFTPAPFTSANDARYARDVFSFADYFISTLLIVEAKGLNTSMSDMLKIMTSNKYVEFSTMCYRLRNTQAQWQNGDLKVLAKSPQYPLYDEHSFPLLPYSVLIGQESESSHATGPLQENSPVYVASKLMPDQQSFRAQGFEKQMGNAVSRVSVWNKKQITYFKAWLAFMEKFYLAASPEEAASIKVQVDKIDSRIKAYEYLQRVALTRAKVIYDEVGACLNTVAQYEALVRNKIITDEVAHLGGLWDSFHANEDAPQPDMSWYNSILSDVKFAKKDDFALDVNSKTFKISKIGALLNLRQHVMQTTGGTMIIPSGYEASPEYTKALGQSKTLNFTLSRESFQKVGTSYQFGDDSTITSWSANQIYKMNYVYYSYNLFNIGPVDYLAGPADKCSLDVILSNAILSANSGCEPVNGYLVKPEQVIEDTIQYARSFDISPKAYETTYKYTGRTTVEKDLKKFNDMFISVKSADTHLNILSKIYKEIIQAVNDYKKDDAGAWGDYPFTEAVNLQDTTKISDLLIFTKDDDSYLGILKDLYRPLVSQFVKPVLDFECAIGKRAAQDYARGAFEITYERGAAITKAMHFDPKTNRSVYADEDTIQAHDQYRQDMFGRFSAFYNTGVSAESKLLTIDDFKSPYEKCYKEAGGQ